MHYELSAIAAPCPVCTEPEGEVLHRVTARRLPVAIRLAGDASLGNVLWMRLSR